MFSTLPRIRRRKRHLNKVKNSSGTNSSSVLFCLRSKDTTYGWNVIDDSSLDLYNSFEMSISNLGVLCRAGSMGSATDGVRGFVFYLISGGYVFS
jgi:hypothetical protein